MPSHKEINAFIHVLIANGSVKREADEIIEELCNKVTTHIESRCNKNRWLKFAFDSTVTFAQCTLFIIYILLFFNSKLNIEQSVLINIPLVITAIILAIITITAFVIKQLPTVAVQGQW